MLTRKRDPYDRNKQQGGEDQVDQRRIQSSAEDPENIKKNGKTTHTITGGDNFAAKRPQYQARNFKTLETKRNTNDRET